MCMSATAAAASPAPTGYQILPYIQYYEAELSTNIDALFVSLDKFFLNLTESAIVFLIILGMLMYFTRLNERTGKKFLEGGILLAVFLAFVAPYLASAYC